MCSFCCILIYRTKKLNTIINMVNIGSNDQLLLTHSNYDLCPTIDTCHHLNRSSIAGNWTQPESLIVNIVFFFLFLDGSSKHCCHIVNHFILYFNFNFNLFFWLEYFNLYHRLHTISHKSFPTIPNT